MCVCIYIDIKFSVCKIKSSEGKEKGEEREQVRERKSELHS